MDFKSKPFEEYVKLGSVRNGKVVEMPAPFNDPDRFPDRISVQGYRNKIAIRPAMTKAFMLLANQLTVSKLVIAHNNAHSVYTGPVWTIEYSEEGKEDVLFQFAPMDLEPFRGAVRDTLMGIAPYKIRSNTGQDATAFWIGVIKAVLDFYNESHVLKMLMDEFKGRMGLQQYDVAWGTMAKCQYFVYEVMTRTNGRTEMFGADKWTTQDTCSQLDLNNLDYGQIEEVFFGNAEWMLGKQSTVKKTEDIFIPNDAKTVAKMHKFMTRKVSDYAPWEKAMIPKLNPKYEETQIDVDIVNAITRTWGKDTDLQVKNFAFFGPAGSGKSAAEEHLASLLKMPFSRQMCSSGDDETSLFGTIIPVVEGMGESLTGEAKAIMEVLEASGDQIDIEAVAEAIGFPDPFMCTVDKDAALSLMGIEDDGTPIMDQRRKAIEKKIIAITEKNEGKSGVTYKYIPSPLVIGIENGHMVAIEEPTNVFNQGIFSCLYDVLDRNSTGVIRTPIGTITRHPDFVCMLSSNTSYTGNRDLPGPLKSRFQYLAHFEEPNEESLAKRVLKKLGRAQEDFDKILKCVKAYKAGNERARDIGQSADYEATPRALFCFADAVLDGIEPQKAYSQYVLPHLANEKEDIEAIWSAIRESEIFW